MVMIFFFVAHEDVTISPHILIGGLAGIICVVLVGEFVTAFGPYIGDEAAKLAFIGIFVYSIVLLKDAIPWVFNSYAFMFFLVSAIAKSAPHPVPYTWIGVELVVGGIFIAGIIGISRTTAAVLGEGSGHDDHE